MTYRDKFMLHLLRLCAAATLLAAISPVTEAQMRSSIPTNDSAAFWQGMDQQREETAAKRAKVLEQLRTIGEDAARQGVAYSYDEWEKLARELAGGFMSTSRPSDSTLQMTLRVQNAQAEAAINRAQAALEPGSRKGSNDIKNQSTWKQVFSKHDANQTRIDTYVDLTSRQKNGSTATIWSGDNFSASQEKGGKIYQSMIVLLESDCAGSRIRPKKIKVYSGQRGAGQIVYAEDNTGPWRDATIVGSKHEALLNVACEQF